jgi:uncharacterized membrane protein YkvA (DUF1232 family)
MSPAVTNQESQDFYQKIRWSIRKWAQSQEGQTSKYLDFLMAAPDLFHLMIKLVADPEVSTEEKARLAGVIAYFVSPLDLLPELILGPIGYLDDIALAAYALNGLINRTSPELVARHWAGNGDVLLLIRQILHMADNMLGSGLWNRIRGKVDKDPDNQS